MGRVYRPKMIAYDVMFWCAKVILHDKKTELVVRRQYSLNHLEIKSTDGYEWYFWIKYVFLLLLSVWIRIKESCWIAQFPGHVIVRHTMKIKRSGIFVQLRRLLEYKKYEKVKKMTTPKHFCFFLRLSKEGYFSKNITSSTLKENTGYSR